MLRLAAACGTAFQGAARRDGTRFPQCCVAARSGRASPSGSMRLALKKWSLSLKCDWCYQASGCLAGPGSRGTSPGRRRCGRPVASVPVKDLPRSGGNATGTGQVFAGILAPGAVTEGLGDALIAAPVPATVGTEAPDLYVFPELFGHVPGQGQRAVRTREQRILDTAHVTRAAFL
jgi:hypothetical protein